MPQRRSLRYSLDRNALFGGCGWQEMFACMRARDFALYETWGIRQEELPHIVQLALTQGMRLTACCPSEFRLNDLERHDAFEEALTLAIAQAKALGGTCIMTQAGQDSGAPDAQQRQAVIAGLKRVEPLLRRTGVTLLLEPLNTVKDHPGTWLRGSDQAADILQAVGSPQVRMLYDVYHMLHMGEDVTAQLRTHWQDVAYIHVAGFPNRDADLRGGFDYGPLLDMLAERQFDGVVGLEFFPQAELSPDAVLDALTREL